MFFRLSAKKLQEVFKTTFYVCRGTVCDLNFFFIFWIVLDFLEKPLAWFSKFYLRVQIKNCGRINFFILLFRIFSEFERKTFRLSAKKLQEVVKTTFRVCGWTNFGLGIFLKCFEPFWIFCRNLWHGSQNSIYVSRVKIAEEMVFLFFFSEFFSNFEQKFSDFWTENFKKLTKLPSACSDEQFLAWNFFQKFWAVLDFLRKIWHGSQTSTFVSREKISEGIIFLFFFSDFFRSLSETFFQIFGQKTSRSCQN